MKLRRLFWRICRLFLSDGYKIAETWRRGSNIRIGEGTIIYRDVVFGRGGADPITIGRDCVLTGCTILGHDASTNRAMGIAPSHPSMKTPVVIEDHCFIGYGAIVLMGVRVGEGSIIGAGAVVTKDVPPGTVIAGNPGRAICTVAELVEKRRQIAAEHPEYFGRSR